MACRTNNPPPGHDLADALRRVFGFHAFRANQEEIIRAVLAGRDVFAVMPTGGGKSLCYQLPAYLMDGTCVVISPLISLMKDQVDAAQANGLRAEYLNSSLPAGERSRVLRALRAGRLDLLYVAPERFAMDPFLEALKRVRLCLFAIDEAHCISEWGHDFRPDYLTLSRIVAEFANVPAAAFTATATRRVQQDIIDRLALRRPHTVRASFDRPNLFYRVTPKRDLHRQLSSFLRGREGQAGIIYRTTRSNVEATAAFLSGAGFKAVPYHAGLDDETRKAHQDALNRDEVDVVVATIAFGMGIDKSNVRFVVHGDLPKNIESYYQETGRAGRDGEPAECVLFFARGDAAKVRYFIDGIEDDTQRQVASDKLNEMVRLASVNVCRRRRLLDYFGERLDADNCGGCDVCAGGVETVDATTEAQIVMSAVARTGQRFGAAHVVDVVVGANTQRIRDLGHDRIKTHGAGKHHDKRFWRQIIDDLIAQECIVRTEGRYPVLRLTPKGRDVLFGRQTFSVLRRPEPKRRRRARQPAQTAVELGDVDHALFEQLRHVRRDLARARRVPPYVVFSDRTLREMAARRPTTDAGLAEITGVGETKLHRYGRQFLAAICEHVGAEPPSTALPAPPEGAPQPKRARGKTYDQTWLLLREGLSIREVAERRGLTPETIAAHVERLLLSGRPLDIDRHVPPAKRARIEALFSRVGTARLREIVDAAGGEVSYEEARLVRAVLRARGEA